MTNQSASELIMVRLRGEADHMERPEIRHATLGRLVEACDAIASGEARKVIKQGNPKAEVYFQRPPVSIKPPRVEEYVAARRAIDQRNGVSPSSWTGPVAASLRKEMDGMLAYVRAREEEQGKTRIPKTATPVEEALESLPDHILKARLRRELAEGRQAVNQLAVLKRAICTLRPTFDIDAFIRGDLTESAAPSVQALPAPARLVNSGEQEALSALLARLTDDGGLSEFGLTFDGRRVKHRNTRDTLVSPEALSALSKVIRGA